MLSRLYFKPKNMKKIPLPSMLGWLFLTVLLVLLFIEAFFSAPKRFDFVQEKQITVERIEINGRHRGSKNLLVYAEDQNYYMSTGPLRARASVQAICEAWDNGTISSGDTVTVHYVDESRVPFRSYRYKNLIVSLQTEDAVYYDLDTAKKIAFASNTVTIIIFFPLFLVWIGFTYLFLIADSILVFRQSKKRVMHKKYKKSQ